MLILIFLYLLLPLTQVYLFIIGQFGADIFDILNFTTSICALHWLLANVIIASKIPVLQRSIPYDERIRFHILSTAGIGLAILYHSVYKFVLEYYISPVTWALIIIFSLMLLSALLWIPIPGFTKMRAGILKKMKKNGEANYDRSKIIHRFFVLIVGFLLLLHITEAGLFDEVNTVSQFLYWLLFGSSFGLFLLSLTNIFKVKARILSVEEKQGIITLHLQPEKKIPYKSGQFTFLETGNSSNKKEEHPFSFLSSPAPPLGDQRDKPIHEPVSLAVRAVGDFTRDLSLLKPGHYVNLKGSFGNFRPGKEQALCFIASGIGTVPIISIMKELHSSGDERPIHLFLAVNHKDELPERDRVLQLTSTMDNVTVHIMVSNEDGQRFSENYFRENLEDHKSFSYYLCSSPGVRTIVLNALKNIGVKKSAIHFEAFSFT